MFEGLSELKSVCNGTIHFFIRKEDLVALNFDNMPNIVEIVFNGKEVIEINERGPIRLLSTG